MTANKVGDKRNLVELQQDVGTLAPGKLIETNHRVDPNLTATAQVPIGTCENPPVIENRFKEPQVSPKTVQVPIGTCENPPVIENRFKEPQVSPKVVVLPPVMTEEEARQCLQEIKGLFDSARAKLLEFKERRGWEALKYSHLTACLEDYFPESRTKLVRELFAAEIERDILQVPIGTCPASHFRPLKKLQPSQYKSALDKAYSFAGNGKLKAAYVTKAVDELLFSTREAKQPKSLPYKPGELVRIKCQVGALAEQKAWDGCWAIVQSTGNIACVRVMVGNKMVDYMAIDMDWDDNSDAQFRNNCERILALWQKDLEPIEQTLLKELQRRRFFTDLETQLISWMESKHSRSEH